MHPGARETEWDRHAREHRRTVRTAIETARDAVLTAVRTRGPVSARAAQTWIRLEAADQIFGALIALSDLLQDETRAEVRDAASRMLRLLRPVLLLLGEAIVTETAKRPLRRFESAAAAIAAYRRLGARQRGAPDRGDDRGSAAHRHHAGQARCAGAHGGGGVRGRLARPPAGPAARQPEPELRGAAPCAADGGGGGGRVRAHPDLADQLRLLADHHPGDDHAAVFRRHLHPRGGADRRHGAGRGDRRRDRHRLPDPALDGGRAVSAGGAGAGRARR